MRRLAALVVASSAATTLTVAPSATSGGPDRTPYGGEIRYLLDTVAVWRLPRSLNPYLAFEGNDLAASVA